MSRRALSAVTTIVAVLVVLGVAVWGRGSDDPASGQARDPGATYSATVVAPTPTGPGATAPGDDVDPSSGLPWVDVADLPAEARTTLERIDAGGPFPYPGKDGSTFHNLERLLPAEPRGYYAEYTVPTPGSRDRGARRIITGEGGEFYWTADHYAHFERIRR
jgi:ribonuclease T1